MTCGRLKNTFVGRSNKISKLEVQLKTMLITLLLFMHCGIASAGRGTNDLLLDVSVAVRGLHLTDAQKALLDSAVEKTTKLPDITTGTKKSFKESLTLVIDNDKATFIDLVTAPASHFSGRLHEVVIGHFDIAMKWAEFDDSLEPEQRRNFRTRMSETIRRTFQSMTSNAVKLVAVDDWSTGDYAGRLEMNVTQQMAIKKLHERTIPEIQSLDKKSNEALKIVNTALADPNVKFSEVPYAMRRFYEGLIQILAIKNAYIGDVYEQLDDRQKKAASEIVRGRLKLLRLVL